MKRWPKLSAWVLGVLNQGRIVKRWPKLSAWILGALTSAALPPHFLFPILFLTFGGLILLSKDRPLLGVFACGWWFGFGYALSGLYWISFAFLVRGGDFIPMIPPAIIGLCAIIALFPALALMAWAKTTRYFALKGIESIVLFAAFWTLGEWLQGRWIANFPWNPIGVAWGFHDVMIQPASLGGVWFLSFLAVLIASLPVVAFLGASLPMASSPYRYDARGRFLALGMSVTLVGLMVVYGSLRLSLHSSIGHQPVMLHVVQANIDQYAKHDSLRRGDHFDLQWSMSRDALTAHASASMTQVLIWPEDSFFHVMQRDSQQRRAVGSLLSESGIALIGALRFSMDGKVLKDVWNSLYVLDSRGDIRGVYDKHRLVPFGEYMPLRDYWGLEKITPGQRDFSAGGKMVVIDQGRVPPFTPLICYEAIFSARIIPSDRPRPQWLLNVTNDGWFGRSSGPSQHFTLARLRAVEEGLPFVRAANTGISAVIDPYGRIIAMLPLGAVGVISIPLPNPAPKVTLYGRYGDIGFFLFGMVLVGGWLGCRWGRVRERCRGRFWGRFWRRFWGR